MSKVQVITEQHCTVTREATEDKWDGTDTHTSWSVLGIVLGDNYPSIETDFDVVPNETYYLVYAVYSTGDSFHHEEDGCLEVVGLYQDQQLANAIVDEIRNHSDWYKTRSSSWRRGKTQPSKYKDGYTLRVEDDRKDITIYAPWNGYFEHLGYVEALPVQLSGKKYRK